MSQTKLEKLTPEQEALIPIIIRDEWIKIALDTSPTDKQKAEEAICFTYKCAGLKPPQQILWFDNPLAAVTWIAINKDTLLGSFVNEPLWFDFIDEPLWFDFAETSNNASNVVIDDTVRDTVKRAVSSSVAIEVWRFRDALCAVWDALDKELLNNKDSYFITDLALEHFPNGLSQLEDLAFYAYFHAIGVDYSKLEGWWATAKHCGWWWSFEELAVVTPKPLAIRLDAEGRLHGEGVPAIDYEGFHIYAFHGVRLPEEYGKVNPNQWQAKWLLEEKNAELWQVLIQDIGYAHIIQKLQGN